MVVSPFRTSDKPDSQSVMQPLARAASAMLSGGAPAATRARTPAT